MGNPVRWGILGASKFALEKMGPAIHAAKGAELAALATSSVQKAEPFQAYAPNIAVYEHYDALLADPDIDAVYIPLPNHLHVEWSRKALNAGKHVLCEKPIAMSASEIDELIALRDQSGLLCAEAFMIVHHPQWIKARELVQGGAIGTLRAVRGAFSYDNSHDPGNIRNASGSGGGGIPDIGVYTYGSARFVTGQEPLEILSADITWENGVDVTAHVSARFETFHYFATTSMRMAPWQEMTFHGDKGVVRLSTPFNAQVYGQAEVSLQREDFVVETHRYPSANHYVLQVEAFCRSVREGADYPCPLEFSQGTQAMIDRVFASAKH